MRMVVMLVARRNGGRPAGASVCRTCRNALNLGKQHCRCDSHDQFRGRHAILRPRGYHGISKMENYPAFFCEARRLHNSFSDPAAIGPRLPHGAAWN
jgi:hypothetical protein